MTEATTCPRCGGTLPGVGRFGLCPSCLLGLALGTGDGPEGGEPVHRGAERGDPILRIVGARQQRQRQHRRDGGHGRRGAEAARRELLERLRVVAVLGELQLPDPDPVDTGGGIGANVVGEARGERAHLRDRELRGALGFPRHAEAPIVSRV